MVIKIRMVFTLLGCPYCEELSLPIIQRNITLPINDKIEFIDLFSQDPRLSMMAAMQKSEDPRDWAAPSMIIDSPRVDRCFNSFREGRGERSIIHGVFNAEHTLNFLNGLIWR